MSGPIDDVAFANLVEMTGGELVVVDELVDTFLEDALTQLDAMRAASAGGDLPTLTRAAHSLKSGSLNVGAVDLGGLCRALEEAGRSGVVPDAEPQIAAIASAFNDARGALLGERERRAAD